jgi:hypothetical protein
MEKVKLTPEEIESELSQCYGSDTVYKHSFVRSVVYTEGVRSMAILCGAYWLIDEIVLLQKKAMADPMLREIQFWTFKKNATGNGGKLECFRDTDDKAFGKRIEFIDFPLQEIKIRVSNGVMYLPTEE